MITILNYGLGNLLSIKNMLKKVEADSVITNDIQDVKAATKIILPGVGHFDYGMKKLRESGFYDVLQKKATLDKIPVLGICLGAQMLLNGSEEGTAQGLAWVNGYSRKFDFSSLENKLPIPNMGWQDVQYVKHTELTYGLDLHPRYYFVHSYCMQCENEEDVLATAHYGYNYTVAFQHENIYGVQFHPEKSHRFGMQLLKNFTTI